MLVPDGGLDAGTAGLSGCDARLYGAGGAGPASHGTHHRHVAGAPTGLGTVIFLSGFKFGRFGVALFFLSSGCVIPFSFKGDRPLAGFAISRMSRLYPAYWLSVALVIYATVPAPSPTTTTLLANITMLQRFVGKPGIVAVYWTLSIKLRFCVLCAGLFAIGWLSDVRMIAATTVVFLPVGIFMAVSTSITERHIPANVATNLSFMFTGTLLRRDWIDHNVRARTLLTWVMAAVDFGRAAAWFGAISYSFYLFQEWLIALFHHSLDPGVAYGPLRYVLAVATLGVSAAIYYWAEKPGVRIDHRLMRRIGGRHAATPAPAA